MALELDPSIKSSDSGSEQDDTPVRDDGVIVKYPQKTAERMGRLLIVFMYSMYLAIKLLNKII